MDLFRRLFTQSNAKVPDKPIMTPDKGRDTEDMETEPLVTANDSDVEDTGEVSDRLTGYNTADGATRPLPPETVIASSNEHVVFGQSTDVGMVRSTNQDSVFSFFSTSRSSEQRPDFGLFVVADGMGGHHDGEKASTMATHTLAAAVLNSVYLPILTGMDDADRKGVTETLIEAVQEANSRIIAKVPEGGTTLTSVVLIGDLAHVVHVGDSRVYVVTRDGIEQLTRDHSLVQRLIELDQLTPEEVVNHPQKNVLYRALGQSENVEVDALTRRLPPNARIMLCSDGLWNLLTDDEIREIVLSHENPQEACDKLVALANMHGGTDNITAILLQIPSS